MNPLRRTLTGRRGARALAFALALASGAPALAQSGASLESLAKQLAQVKDELRELAQENSALREEQGRMQRQLAQLASAAAPGAAPEAAPVAASSALPTPAAAAGALTGSGEGPRLWGYGEMYYANPAQDQRRVRADLARAVFGLGYSFDERTEFNSEFEVEHAVASASDAGEFEVEQFYVDRHLTDAVSARAGLFLMPFGFLNEHHEPTRYYGVQRNFIETLIIPSTWREGGFNLHGDTRAGLGWNVGLTTGFDLSKWEFDPQFPLYASALELGDGDAGPLRATHQELSLANARRLSQYAALSYYGVPALALGAALSSGESSSPGDARVTLWEAHARWTPGGFDLTGLYARGAIGGTAVLNAAHPGAVNPVPSAFYGYFLQGAYQLWEQGEYRLAPFARFESYDLGASYSGTHGPVLPSGLVPLSGNAGDQGYWPVNHDRVWSAGANFYLGPHLVLKGDYQWFEENRGFRRFDLGLGVSF
jgi:hypothetical protein